ncbi:hypothetical protein B0J17DRAFT_681281 [Rhizoctonia solani]|nr:hypothetical protein B0J17DRAFT_681281 [Rhizoctonia solani]
MPISRGSDYKRWTRYVIQDHPPRKRPKTTQLPKRVNKVSLGRLLDMPPEVFNEITTYLLPMDLLSLARSNKLFRNLFMSRTSRHLWKQALENVPDLPPVRQT